VVCDALANPLEIALTPGQAGDCSQAEPLLERIVAMESIVAVSEELETSDSKAKDSEQPPALGAVWLTKVTIRTTFCNTWPH